MPPAGGSGPRARRTTPGAPRAPDRRGPRAPPRGPPPGPPPPRAPRPPPGGGPPAAPPSRAPRGAAPLVDPPPLAARGGAQHVARLGRARRLVRSGIQVAHQDHAEVSSVAPRRMPALGAGDGIEPRALAKTGDDRFRFATPRSRLGVLEQDVVQVHHAVEAGPAQAVELSPRGLDRREQDLLMDRLIQAQELALRDALPHLRILGDPPPFGLHGQELAVDRPVQEHPPPQRGVLAAERIARERDRGG